MAYSLRRTRDGAGDSGQMSNAVTFVRDENGRVIDKTVHHDSAPMVGAAMVVGSHYARSFSAQDWWQTTPITEILEERTDPEDPNFLYVRFKTGNSEYEWTRF